MRLRLDLPAAFLALTPRAFAHDGHGDPAWTHSLLHYLIEPAHLPLTLLAAAALLLAAGWAWKRRRRRT